MGGLVAFTIFERVDGLAMGNATSPPITAFDLDYNSRRMYASKEEARRVGAYVPGVPTTRCIQALLHVDDALVFSKIFCCMCLAGTIRKCGPADVEPNWRRADTLSTFSTAQSMLKKNRSTATQSASLCRSQTTLSVEASRRHRRWRSFNNLSPIRFNTKHTCRQVCGGKLAIAVNTCRYDTVYATDYIICAAVEAILWGWCPLHVGQAMAALPKSHRGETANFIRLFGKAMRKSRTTKLAWEHDYGYSTYLSFPWYMLFKTIGEYVTRTMSA
jgi:hypothetical protein